MLAKLLIVKVTTALIATSVVAMVIAVPAIVMEQTGVSPPPTKPLPITVPVQYAGILQLKVLANGTPVKNARLSFFNDRPAFPDIFPDDAGSATIAWPDGQPTNIAVYAPGFAPTFIKSALITQISDHTTILTTGQSIKGTLMNDNGAALAGAKIILTNRDFPLNEDPAFNPTLTIGPDGSFAVDHLADGHYFIRSEIPATHGTLAIQPAEFEIPFEKPPNLALVSVPGMVVRGKFQNAATKNVSARFETWLRVPTSISWIVHPAPDGTFEITGIPANAGGAFELYLSSFDYNARVTWDKPSPNTFLSHEGATFKRAQPGLYEGLNIEILPVARVQGIVQFDDGTPAAGITVQTTESNFCVNTDRNGRFTLRIVPRTRLRLDLLGVDGDFGDVILAEPNQTIERRLTVSHKKPQTAPTPAAPRPAITVEGTVRNRDTGQLVSGAKVELIDGFIGHPAVLSLLTDAQGRFHGEVLDRSGLPETFKAVAGAGDSELEGNLTYSGKPEPGDLANHIDILVSKSPRAILTEWRTKPSPPVPTSSVAIVLDDFDRYPKADFLDTVTAYAGTGKTKWRYDHANASLTTGKPHLLAFDVRDKSTWVCENGAVRLLKLKSDGMLAWELKDIRCVALAVDPATSNGWVLVSEEKVDGKNLRIIDPQGKTLRQIPVEGANKEFAAGSIAYSPFDKSFWVVGNKLQQFDSGGNLTKVSDFGLSFAMSVETDPTTGDVWVHEFGQKRLLHFNHDGQLQQQIPIDALSFALDSQRQCLWIGGKSLTKMSLTGEGLATAPLPFAAPVVEPDTGCVWAVTQDGVYRVAPDGRYLWGTESPAPTSKWITIAPPERK